MRVVSGEAKGRRLKTPLGNRIRPTADRVKETLFDILGDRVQDARVLDLFAGTGQVGIEALSRGAEAAVFVERGAAALRTIRENLEHTGLAELAQVVRADVLAFLARETEPFDYVYIAPPQYKGIWATSLHALDGRPGWLADDGWAIAQIHPKEYEELLLEHLYLFDQRQYGGVMLCFYGREGER